MVAQEIQMQLMAPGQPGVQVEVAQDILLGPVDKELLAKEMQEGQELEVFSIMAEVVAEPAQ